jgi:hypothetical protein
MIIAMSDTVLRERRKQSPRATPAQKAAVLALYSVGKKGPEISASIGLHIRTVERISVGAPKPMLNSGRIQAAVFAELYGNGKTPFVFALKRSIPIRDGLDKYGLDKNDWFQLLLTRILCKECPVELLGEGKEDARRAWYLQSAKNARIDELRRLGAGKRKPDAGWASYVDNMATGAGIYAGIFKRVSSGKTRDYGPKYDDEKELESGRDFLIKHTSPGIDRGLRSEALREKENRALPDTIYCIVGPPATWGYVHPPEKVLDLSPYCGPLASVHANKKKHAEGFYGVPAWNYKGGRLIDIPSSPGLKLNDTGLLCFSLTAYPVYNETVVLRIHGGRGMRKDKES